MSKGLKYKSKILSYIVILTVIFTMVFSFSSVPAHAYVSSLGNVTYVSSSADSLTLTVDNGGESGDDIVDIKVCKDNILRVDYRPNGVAASTDTPMLDPDKTWSAVGATINTAGDPILITTDDMRIEIDKTPCRMTFKKADGTTLFWEPDTTSGGVFYDGVRFKHDTSDNIYGIRGYSCFEDNGDILRNDNSHAAHAGEQGDAGGPFMWSTSGYGVLVDGDGGYPYTNSTYGNMEYYYGGTPTEGRRYSKTDVEYFVILGSPSDIMSGYSEITGKAPLMPKWSLGFSNFEWDIDQTDLINYVDTYRAKNIPIDGYGIDYDWKNYGQTNYGEFTWNTTNFSSAATTALKTTMDGKGIKMIGITKPRIVTMDAGSNRTTQYYDAESGGYWYPGQSEYTDYFIPVQVRSIDPYNSACRAWFWDHSEDAFDKGIVGWWNDETDKVSSGATTYWLGNFTTTFLSQALYEGQTSYSTRRVWQTARTYYPGAQRYATTLWSGDMGIQYYKGEMLSWASGMQEQRSIMLSSVNLGQAKWGMDGGGFNQTSSTVYNPPPQLYTRWLQFGAFSPVFRVHGNNYHQRQPWYYGTTAEEAVKNAIQLRYSLLPYMYSYERNVYDNGVGLVKPLMMDNPTDSSAENYTDAWMFGDYLLVAPVVDEWQNNKSVYLPSGTWTDYFRGITYTGAQTIKYPVNADTWTDIPLFIKKGAIIPTQKVLDYVGQSTISEVFVDIFPDTAETSFTYYDDNGDNYDYESGTYIKQEITAQDNGSNNISIGFAAKSGSYSPSTYSYIAKVHGKAATSATLDDDALTSYDDLNELKAAAGEGWSTGKDVYGEVTYVKVEGGSGSAKDIELSGSASTGLTSYKYEAEEASLSGNTTATKASVNTNHTGYSGAGFAEGFSNQGAAVTFYTSVKNGGDYSVSLRYANATGSAKTMSIFVNGKRVKQTSLANLANWDTWSTQSETLPLTAGNNIITYKYYNDGGDTGNVNLDYITVPFEASVQKYEAESGELSGGAATNKNHYFYSGAAFVDGMTSVGAETKLRVYVPSAGDYKVTLRYANSTGSTKTVSTLVNDSDVATASLTNLANWDTWSDYEQTLSLSAGENTIAYKYNAGDGGNVNIDRILVASSTPGTVESEKNLLDNQGFDRPTSYNNNWTEWHPVGQTLAYGVDRGNTMNPPEAAWTGEARAYFYLASAYQQSIHQQISVANGTYNFEAWVRMNYANPTTARAEIANYGGGRIDVNISNDGVWKYISYSNINVTSGVIDIGFYVNSPGGTVLHIDDVRLTKQ